VPLLVLGAIALWLLLWPVLLWMRYRNGTARRRVQGWVVRVNAWLLLVSVPMFLLGAWVAGHWFEGALLDSTAGLLTGVAVGIVGLWLTRFEHDERGYYYTPNRWLVLALTVLLAVRIVVGVAAGWGHAGADASQGLLEAGGLALIAGIFLGYALAYMWGLRARLPLTR
jgi:uncharacterized membrane protein YiaA